MNILSTITYNAQKVIKDGMSGWEIVGWGIFFVALIAFRVKHVD